MTSLNGTEMEVIVLPFGQKPNAEMQKQINDGKLIKVGSTTGGIVRGGKDPGVIYRPA